MTAPMGAPAAYAAMTHSAHFPVSQLCYRYSFNNTKFYPKLLVLQVGSKQTNPDELTQVSDSGE
ncbi:hypothetical protein FORC066_2228 [Yersinia enterocolitica]|nr:hypothetical protein FORC066_2228 [Yersinia enterocolitica]